MPLLRDVLEAFPAFASTSILSPASRPPAVVDVIRRYGNPGDVLLTSFDDDVRKRLQALNYTDPLAWGKMNASERSCCPSWPSSPGGDPEPGCRFRRPLGRLSWPVVSSSARHTRLDLRSIFGPSMIPCRLRTWWPWAQTELCLMIRKPSPRPFTVEANPLKRIS